jgi:hypothetical protein
MGAQGSPPPEPRPEQRQQADWHDPQRHGSKAAIWVAIIATVALVGNLGNFVFTWSSRSEQHRTKDFNHDVNDLIDASPHVKALGELTTNVGSLTRLKARSCRLSTSAIRSRISLLSWLSRAVCSAVIALVFVMGASLA